MKNTLIALLTIILLAVSSVAFAAEYSLCYAMEYDNILLASLLLFATAKDGDLSEVKRWLGEGADVNGNDEDDKAALMLAAENGKIEVVQLLLGKGGGFES